MNTATVGFVAAPGIYEMEPGQYHADPCPLPSLSSSIARTLIRRSPLHAHAAHPRLGGAGGTRPTRAMDDGSVVHSLLLDKGATVVPLRAVYGPKHERAGEPVTDFATKAAQEERDALREAGHLPVLAHRLPELRRCAAAIARNLRFHQDGGDFFAPGRTEAVVVWEEDGIWLRCMVDRLPDDPRAPPYDIKTTALSAAPGGWERRLQTDYAFQAAFYARGLRAVRGVTPAPMRFVVGEIEPPHGVAVMCAAPSLQAIAEAEVERAVALWRRCITEDFWPGYPPFTAHVEAPTWMLTQQDEAQMRDHFAEEHA